MWQIAWTSGGTVRDGRLAERTRTSLSNFSHGVRKGVEVVTRRLLQGLLQGVQGFVPRRCSELCFSGSDGGAAATA